MTPLTWGWLLSLSAAGLFLAAGAARAARRFDQLVFACPQLTAAGENVAVVPAAAPALPAAARNTAEAASSEADARRVALQCVLAQRTAERQQLARDLAVERYARLRHDEQHPRARDELGPSVAARSGTHEYNDALAALGAYLADVGSKTRDILRLRTLRHVPVCDAEDVTLTVGPLATDDPRLALVALELNPRRAPTDNSS